MLAYALAAHSQNDIDSLQKKLITADSSEKLDLELLLSKAYWSVEPVKGLGMANKAIRLAEQTGKPEKKAKALLYGGVNYWAMGEYDHAMHYSDSCLRIAENTGNRKLAAFAMNNIGLIYRDLGDYDKAMGQYTAALVIMEELGDKIEYAKILNSIGKLNTDLHRYESALKNFQTVITLVKNTNERKLYFWVLNDVGEVYSRINQPDKALGYFNQALQIAGKLGDQVGKSMILINLSYIHLNQRKFSEAIFNLKTAVELARLANARDRIMTAWQRLSEAYALMGDYRQSLEYFRLFKVMSDSIYSESKMKNIISIQTRYETRAKEKEIELLHKDAELNRMRISKQNSVRIFLVVLLIMVMILTLITYSRLQLKKKANRTKDRFFSIIAHDLKSPFNSIIGYSNLLMDQIRENDLEGIEKYAAIIRNSSQRVFDLLTNLLDWSLAQTGRMKFNPESTDIVTLIHDVIKISSDTAQQKSIAISTELPQRKMVIADKAMLEIILRNLISNAIKFTGQGGVIVVALEQLPEQTVITLRDNGVGIKKESLDKLFKMDENYSTLGTNKEKGSGLGLILCKEFVEKHGGRIWVESETGKGSQFYFSLPGNYEDPG